MGVWGGIILRHVLTFAGGAAGYIGMLDGSKLQLVAGALSTLVGVGLSYLNKKK